MASVIQFVDSIASSPAVRLDLNAASGTNAFMVDVAGMDLSPPPMRRSFSSTMLTDGDRLTASAFENRTIGFTVRLVRATTTDAAATAVQTLARELNRPTNILKVQLEGATSPVFFRTYRAPDYTLSMVRLLFTENTAAALELLAEPFGLGLLETPVSAVTVQTDPASGAGNACFVDVTGVKGDVETPAFIQWPSVDVNTDRRSLIAVRRRGTPSSAPFLLQAEAMTQGTDTSTQVNDANFSGAGNNYSRTTFATATMQTRLSVLTLGTNGVDLRGRYRVFLRYRKNTAADDINVQLRWGDTEGLIVVDNDAVALPNTTTIKTADLGEINIPTGYDPVTDGPSGVELEVANNYSLAVRAERTGGSGTLDSDLLVSPPADDRLAIVQWVDLTASPSDHWILDAATNNMHARNSSGRVYPAAASGLVGGLPMLTPNQTNRVYMLRDITGGADSNTWSLSNVLDPVSVSYWPRYLSVRPAST